MTVGDINITLSKIYDAIEICEHKIPKDAYRGQEPLVNVVNCLNECARVMQMIKVDI